MEKVHEVWEDTDWDGRKGFPPHSIFYSEALAIYTLAKEFKIDLLIESGVFGGGSTLTDSSFAFDLLSSGVNIVCISPASNFNTSSLTLIFVVNSVSHPAEFTF